jgi:hypothetical protein|nr:MAG TPA: minor structural protein [Caudoviricetes sp.]
MVIRFISLKSVGLYALFLYQKLYRKDAKMKKEEFIALGISDELAESAAAASNTELQNYISLEQHEQDKKKIEDDYKGKIKDIKIETAINEAFRDANHPELLVSLVDQSRLELHKDGTITGLDEQKKGLREKYKDLFPSPNKKLETETKTDPEKSQGEQQEKQPAGKKQYTPKDGEKIEEGFGSQIAAQRNEVDSTAANNSLWGAE